MNNEEFYRKELARIVPSDSMVTFEKSYYREGMTWAEFEAERVYHAFEYSASNPLPGTLFDKFNNGFWSNEKEYYDFCMDVALAVMCNPSRIKEVMSALD